MIPSRHIPAGYYISSGGALKLKPELMAKKQEEIRRKHKQEQISAKAAQARQRIHQLKTKTDPDSITERERLEIFVAALDISNGAADA